MDEITQGANVGNRNEEERGYLRVRSGGRKTNLKGQEGGRGSRRSQGVIAVSGRAASGEKE